MSSHIHHRIFFVRFSLFELSITLQLISHLLKDPQMLHQEPFELFQPILKLILYLPLAYFTFSFYD